MPRQDKKVFAAQVKMENKLLAEQLKKDLDAVPKPLDAVQKPLDAKKKPVATCVVSRPTPQIAMKDRQNPSKRDVQFVRLKTTIGGNKKWEHVQFNPIYRSDDPNTPSSSSSEDSPLDWVGSDFPPVYI
jgi:hypothetical protein